MCATGGVATARSNDLMADNTLQEINAKLTQIRRQQDAIIMAVNANTDGLGILAAQVAEVVAWMNKPASTDLADAIKAMTAAIQAVEAAVSASPQRIANAVVSRLR